MEKRRKGEKENGRRGEKVKCKVKLQKATYFYLFQHISNY
jgi:hypothetical protein